MDFSSSIERVCIYSLKYSSLVRFSLSSIRSFTLSTLGSSLHSRAACEVDEKCKGSRLLRCVCQPRNTCFRYGKKGNTWAPTFSALLSSKQSFFFKEDCDPMASVMGFIPSVDVAATCHSCPNVATRLKNLRLLSTSSTETLSGFEFRNFSRKG